jgi:hypothetical protein
MNFIHSIKNAVSSKTAQATTLLAATLFTAQVHAASYLPAGVFTGVLADAVDTVTDVMLYLVPIGIGVAVAKSVLGWTKGGTTKALR